MAETGLSQQQLGITRIYEVPHTPSGAKQRGDSEEVASAEPSTPRDAGQHLAGEAVLIKDLQQVAGETSTFGSEALALTAAYHDSAATRLLDAGATLVGASATSEFGVTAYTEPVGQDAPINPLDHRLSPGGSSGGAAVAIARGLVRIAHATDGGGSIRIPAACCGLPGLKPTHDNRVGGFTPTAHGYLAQDIPTTAHAYNLTLPAQSTHPTTPLRIGYTNTPFHHLTSTVDPIVAASTAAVTALLTTTPAVSSVTHAPAPYAPHRFELFKDFLTARCADLPGPLSPITSWLQDQGRKVPRWRREEAQKQLLTLAEEAHRNWHDFDIIATPTLACAPPPPGAFSKLPPHRNFRTQTAWTPWGTLWNITGWACLSVPLVDPSMVPGRWPVSLLLGAVGARVSEAQLLAVGQLVQEVAWMLPAESLSLEGPGNVEALCGDEDAHEH